LHCSSGRVQLKRPEDHGHIQLECKESQLLHSLILDDTNLRSVQARIEKWFDDSTARLTEYYKRIAQGRLLAVSVALALGFWVDALAIAQHVFIRNTGPLSIPVGWDNASLNPLAIAGCLLSAFAISQGAPFWFDLLNRLVNLRQTGRRLARGASFAAD
jgi:hypothetical protein